MSFAKTRQYSVPTSCPIAPTYLYTLEPLVISLYPSLNTLLTWSIAFPTCCSRLPPCGWLSISLCVSSSIEPCLNSLFTDSVVTYDDGLKSSS